MAKTNATNGKGSRSIDEALQFYYKNEAEELHRLVKKIMSKKFGDIFYDIDEFYDVANEIIAKIVIDFDSTKGSFEDFLKHSLERRLMNHVSNLNMQKRQQYVRDGKGNILYFDKDGNLLKGEGAKENGKPMIQSSISLNADIDESDSESSQLIETISGKGTVESEIFVTESKTDLYLANLTETQKKVLVCMVSGYKVNQIPSLLGLNKSIVANCVAAIRSYENVKVLY